MALVTLTDTQKGELFKLLATKSMSQAAMEFKLDAVLASKYSLNNYVRRVVAECKAEPAKYGLSLDVVALVEKAISERKGTKNQIVLQPNQVPLAEQREAQITDMDVKQLIVSGSKKLWLLTHKKIDMLNHSRKELQKQPLTALVIAAATAIDKARLLQGESTENLAVKGSISETATSEDLMNILLQRREDTFITNQQKPSEKA